MPRTDARGGPRTRARIAEAAAALFLDRGFDAVTVAEVARAAGVSSVTVFNHFPRKEDLYLDRSAEAEELLRSAARAPDPLTALEEAALRLAEERHPLSGLDPRSAAFFATVAASPALVARSREIAAELQATLAEACGDELLAALVIAGYAGVLVQTARRPDPDDHRVRLERLFAVLRRGLRA